LTLLPPCLPKESTEGTRTGRIGAPFDGADSCFGTIVSLGVRTGICSSSGKNLIALAVPLLLLVGGEVSVDTIGMDGLFPRRFGRLGVLSTRNPNLVGIDDLLSFRRRRRPVLFELDSVGGVGRIGIPNLSNTTELDSVGNESWVDDVDFDIGGASTGSESGLVGFDDLLSLRLLSVLLLLLLLMMMELVGRIGIPNLSNTTELDFSGYE